MLVFFFAICWFIYVQRPTTVIGYRCWIVSAEMIKKPTRNLKTCKTDNVFSRKFWYVFENVLYVCQNSSYFVKIGKITLIFYKQKSCILIYHWDLCNSIDLGNHSLFWLSCLGSLVFLLQKTQIIWLSNLLTLSVLNEGYSINVLFAQNWIRSAFFFRTAKIKVQVVFLHIKLTIWNISSVKCTREKWN